MIRPLKKIFTSTVKDVSIIDNLLIVNNKTKYIYYIPNNYGFHIENLLYVNNKYFALCRGAIIVLDINNNSHILHEFLNIGGGSTFTDCIFDPLNKEYIIVGTNSSVYYLSEGLSSSLVKDTCFDKNNAKSYSLKRVQIKDSQLIVNDSYVAFKVNKFNNFTHDWDKSLLLFEHGKSISPNNIFPQLYFLLINGREVVLSGQVTNNTYFAKENVVKDPAADVSFNSVKPLLRDSSKKIFKEFEQQAKEGLEKLNQSINNLYK